MKYGLTPLLSEVMQCGTGGGGGLYISAIN